MRSGHGVLRRIVVAAAAVGWVPSLAVGQAAATVPVVVAGALGSGKRQIK